MSGGTKMFWKKFGFAVLAVATAVGVPLVAQTRAPQQGRSTILRGFAPRGYLGVGVVELTDERVKALKLKDDTGVEVKYVDANSPAAKAGLKENDVILEVNGRGVEDIVDFQNSIGDLAPGSKVSLTVWREGAKKTISATLDQRQNLFVYSAPVIPDAPIPPMPPIPLNGGSPFPTIPATSPLVGIEGESLNAQLAAYFGVKEGVLVRSVNANTPADHAGMKAGDVIVKVDGIPVTTPREITALVGAHRNKAVVFTVVRNKKEIKLNIEIALDRFGPSDRVAL